MDVSFEGDAKAIVKCNLWLRTADRLKIVVGRFNAKTFDELFEKQKLYHGKILLIKKVNFLYKDEASNLRFTVCQTAKLSLRKLSLNV